MKPLKRLSDFINESTPFIFLKECIKPEDKLNDDEYYVQMVIQPGYPTLDSPYVKFIDPHSHNALVGVEKPSSKNDKGWYISKSYYKRNSRGIVCLVKVSLEDLKNCTII